MREANMDAKRFYSRSHMLYRAANQLLYPRRCPFCGRVLGFVPVCEECVDLRDALERRPSKRLEFSEHYLGAIDGAAAVFHYEGVVREAILRAKYGGERWTADELGVYVANYLFGGTFTCKRGVAVPEEMHAAGLEYDVVVPVPASSGHRGYNVPHRIALPIAKALGRPLLPLALKRRRFDRHQAGLPLEERLANVAGAFSAVQPERLEGKRVLLVDDVITTGATVAACGQAILDAGAESVFAVSVATPKEKSEKSKNAT
jgi:predicted amidophosphoribosyltransferase